MNAAKRIELIDWATELAACPELLDDRQVASTITELCDALEEQALETDDALDERDALQSRLDDARDALSAEACLRADVEKERDALRFRLDESEHAMHMRIRGEYDRTIADSWRAKVAAVEAERDAARSECAVLKDRLENDDSVPWRRLRLDRDAARFRVKEVEAERDRLRQELVSEKDAMCSVIQAAEDAGWNGVENPKRLSDFIEWLGKERDALKARIKEREGEMPERIRADLHKTMEECWQVKVAQLEAERDALKQELACWSTDVGAEFGYGPGVGAGQILWAIRELRSKAHRAQNALNAVADQLAEIAKVS